MSTANHHQLVRRAEAESEAELREPDQSTNMAITAKLKNAPTNTLSVKVIGRTLRAGATREDMAGRARGNV